MITAIVIENFKGTRERVRLSLKPVTLLFGPNSAGKSTILHATHYAREVLCPPCPGRFRRTGRPAPGVDRNAVEPVGNLDPASGRSSRRPPRVR